MFTFFFIYLSQVFNVVYFSLFSASVRPCISNEQEAFIRQVLEIPFDEQRCRDLITLDSLHAYCKGPESTPTAHRLHGYSRRRKLYSFLFPIVFICVCLSNIHLLSFAKMEAGRQKARVRAIATSKKKKEKDGASSLAPKDVTKGFSKRKSDRKDDRLLKKGPGVPAGDKKPKQPLPSKPSHRSGKGLMTKTSPVT